MDLGVGFMFLLREYALLWYGVRRVGMMFLINVGVVIVKVGDAFICKYGFRWFDLCFKRINVVMVWI
jgi:hypothetical protein